MKDNDVDLQEKYDLAKDALSAAQVAMSAYKKAKEKSSGNGTNETLAITSIMINIDDCKDKLRRTNRNVR